MHDRTPFRRMDDSQGARCLHISTDFLFCGWRIWKGELKTRGLGVSHRSSTRDLSSVESVVM